MTALSKLMKAARESVDAAVDQLSPEQIAENDAALEDTGITVDVIDDVQAPVADLDAGLAEVDSAEAEAVSLDTTAAALTASLDPVAPAAIDPAAAVAPVEGEAAAAVAPAADPIPGQGVDPVAAELVSDQIAAAVERFQLAVTSAGFARESFNTSAGRRDVTRRLAKEAEEAAASLRQRATEAIKKALEWLKDMLKTAFDQAYRIQKRAKALATAAGSSKAAGGQELKINGAFLNGKDAAETARDLGSLHKGLGALASAVTTGAAATTESIDLNPQGVGGVALRVEFSDKASFVKEAGNGEGGKITSFDAATAKNIANMVAAAAASLTAAKGDFDAITKNSLSLIGAIKTEGSAGERAKAVSTVTAVTRAAGAVVSLGLSTGSRLLDAVDASLKVKAAEPAAAAAAA